MKKKLNGSVDLLAEAMRQVFTESVEAVESRMTAHFDKRIDGLDKRIDGLDKRIDGLDRRIDGLEKRIDVLDKNIDTTNQNMQAQFAEQEKKIGQLLKSKR